MKKQTYNVKMLDREGGVYVDTPRVGYVYGIHFGIWRREKDSVWQVDHLPTGSTLTPLVVRFNRSTRKDVVGRIDKLLADFPQIDWSSTDPESFKSHTRELGEWRYK